MTRRTRGDKDFQASLVEYASNSELAQPRLSTIGNQEAQSRRSSSLKSKPGNSVVIGSLARSSRMSRGSTSRERYSQRQSELRASRIRVSQRPSSRLSYPLASLSQPRRSGNASSYSANRFSNQEDGRASTSRTSARGVSFAREPSVGGSSINPVGLVRLVSTHGRNTLRSIRFQSLSGSRNIDADEVVSHESLSDDNFAKHSVPGNETIEWQRQVDRDVCCRPAGVHVRPCRFSTCGQCTRCLAARSGSRGSSSSGSRSSRGTVRASLRRGQSESPRAYYGSESRERGRSLSVGRYSSRIDSVSQGMERESTLRDFGSMSSFKNAKDSVAIGLYHPGPSDANGGWNVSDNVKSSPGSVFGSYGGGGGGSLSHGRSWSSKVPRASLDVKLSGRVTGKYSRRCRSSTWGGGRKSLRLSRHLDSAGRNIGSVFKGSLDDGSSKSVSGGENYDDRGAGSIVGNENNEINTSNMGYFAPRTSDSPNSGSITLAVPSGPSNSGSIAPPFGSNNGSKAPSIPSGPSNCGQITHGPPSDPSNCGSIRFSPPCCPSLNNGPITRSLPSGSLNSGPMIKQGHPCGCVGGTKLGIDGVRMDDQYDDHAVLERKDSVTNLGIIEGNQDFLDSVSGENDTCRNNESAILPVARMEKNGMCPRCTTDNNASREDKFKSELPLSVSDWEMEIIDKFRNRNDQWR